MKELLPGLYQLETELGDNRLCLYVLRGQRTVLVDSGIHNTPNTLIYPTLAAAGLPAQIDILLVTHADADHHGGNAAIQARSPQVTIMCHELDRPRVESKVYHLDNRYTKVIARADVGYAPEIMAWLSEVIGPDTPVHLGLRGGESLGLGNGPRWQVLHTPGHTAGHLSLWNPEQRALIIQDAVLGAGQPNRQGQITSPPPYYDVDGYADSIRQLQALPAEWLLTAHYPIMRGPEIADFLAASLEFVDTLDAAVLEALQSAGQPLTLGQIIKAVDARLGPFEVNIQWIGPTLAHLNRYVAQGYARQRQLEGIHRWEAIQ